MGGLNRKWYQKNTKNFPLESSLEISKPYEKCYRIFRINFMLNKCHEQFTPCGEEFCNIHEIFNILNIYQKILSWNNSLQKICVIIFIFRQLFCPLGCESLRFPLVEAGKLFTPSKDIKQNIERPQSVCVAVKGCFTKKTNTTFGSQWFVTVGTVTDAMMQCTILA